MTQSALLRFDPAVQLTNINYAVFSDRQKYYLAIAAKLFNKPICATDVLRCLRDS
jgi:hypothetical protein